jgi:redox-sensitive bicupin YhaK (pirin superfamily)
VSTLSTPTAPTAPAPRVVLETVALGAPPWATVDPFLFCVHHDDAYPAGNEQLGPAVSLAGRDLGQDFAGKDGWRMYHGHVVPGFPAHPHRGFETVTIVRRGLIDHHDSLGAAARYGRGDVQWLTAGAGISHSEMFPLVDASAPNPTELFQIWLNLRAADKLSPPHFTMFWSRDIPRRTFTDAAGRATEVTIVAGALDGTSPLAPPPHSWAARRESDVAIWTIRMAPRASWALPPAGGAETVRTLYFFRGPGLRVGGEPVRAPTAVLVRSDAAVPLEAGDGECEVLLLQGRPIGEPVVAHGPFVMNSRAEIQRAFADYQRTRFGGWPWKSDDPVFPREEGRFARHADGRIERAEP